MSWWMPTIGTRDSGLGTRQSRDPRPATRDLLPGRAWFFAESGNRRFGRASASADASRFSRVPGPESRVPAACGFTLLEVLAAIALLAIVFAIGLSTLGKSVHNAASSVALDTAVQRAQSLLAGQGLTAPLHDETLAGQFDDGMDWTLKIHALPRPAAAPAGGEGAVFQQGGALMAQAGAIELYQLDVAVQYGADRSLRLSTQRAQAASGPGP